MIIIPRYMTMRDLAAWLACEFPGKTLRYIPSNRREVYHG